MKIMSLRHAERGFTLVELLVATVVASLVGMAAYTVFSTSSRSYVAQEDVSETQQNVRVAMERLSKDIRSAGFGLPDDPSFSLSIGGENHTAPVDIGNSSTGPDTLTLLGIGHEAGTLDNDSAASCNGMGDSYICLDSVDSMDEFYNDDHTVFNGGRRYVSLDGIKFLELSSSTADHNRTSRTLKLLSPATLDRGYADGTRVYIIQAIRYSRNTSLDGCSAATPCLARRDMAVTNEVQAMDIEDIQFAYSLDGNPSFASGSVSSTDIVSVRATIIGRSRRPDPRGGGISYRPAAEDHAAGDVDNYRRRALTRVVKVRNPRNGS